MIYSRNGNFIHKTATNNTMLKNIKFHVMISQQLHTHTRTQQQQKQQQVQLPRT